ncbi:hypothetical protein [Oceanobacillus luteolus]|uniref:Uncharacterized protein n=1 Tax=Oceanobacillus luteolus TaxID=1274358 RepID=A0ABW4HW10_9BACI
MKETMQTVLHLAKPELKVSKGNFINLLLFFTIYTVLIIMGFDLLGNSKFAILDLLFILLFFFGPTWFKAKGFQYQKISGGMWGSPAVVMNLHLPINGKIIVWKTIFIYFLSSIPFQLYMLLMVYLFNPDIRGVLEPGSYIAFALIWLSFGIYGGLAALSLEVVVYKIPSGKMISVLSVLLVILGIAVILFFPYIFENSIVGWSAILADRWSIASGIISILLAIVGLRYWSNKMTEHLYEVDYL